MTLTKEQKLEYIESGGIACPYCGAQSLEKSEVEYDADSLTVEVECRTCQENWIDEYKISGIAEL